MQTPSKYHLTAEQIEGEWAEVKAAQNDMDRFETLYRRHYESIFRFVYRRSEDMDTAADITSEVFLTAMLRLHTYHNRGLPFASWLFRITVNQINMAYRKKKMRRLTGIEDMRDLAVIARDAQEEENEEKIEAIVDLLGDLSDGEMTLIDLKYFQKKPLCEVADILGLSEVNARVRMHRLLGRIRKQLNATKEQK